MPCGHVQTCQWWNLEHWGSQQKFYTNNAHGYSTRGPIGTYRGEPNCPQRNPRRNVHTYFNLLFYNGRPCFRPGEKFGQTKSHEMFVFVRNLVEMKKFHHGVFSPAIGRALDPSTWRSQDVFKLPFVPSALRATSGHGGLYCGKPVQIQEVCTWDTHTTVRFSALFGSLSCIIIQYTYCTKQSPAVSITSAVTGRYCRGEV